MTEKNDEIRQIAGEVAEVNSSRWHREGTNDYSNQGLDIEQIIDRWGQPVEAVQLENWTEVSPGIETCSDLHRHRHVRIHRRACHVRILLRSWYEYVSYDYWEHNSGRSELYCVRFEA